MKTQQERLETIIKKVHAQLQQTAVLQREFEHQRKALYEMKAKHEKQQEQLRLLQEQNHILQAAAGNMNEPDKKEFEKLISKYLRDIDKCIALLSE